MGQGGWEDTGPGPGVRLWGSRTSRAGSPDPLPSEDAPPIPARDTLGEGTEARWGTPPRDISRKPQSHIPPPPQTPQITL